MFEFFDCILIRFYVNYVILLSGAGVVGYGMGSFGIKGDLYCVVVFVEKFIEVGLFLGVYFFRSWG